MLMTSSLVLAVEKSKDLIDTSDVVKNEDAFTSEELDQSTVETSSLRSVEPACVNKCTETDNGMDIYNKGITTYNNHQYTDRCIGKKDLYLKEYYCSDNHKKVKVVRCANGCLNGACIPNEVPEFGTIAALVALLGSAGIFMVIRRKH